MKAAALYARVSTADGRQNAENQLAELRRIADKNGWRIYREYVDQVSGARRDRDALAELMGDAHGRRFDVVLVFALDRFTREGVLETFKRIDELSRYGVEFHSATEPHFTTAGPLGELFVAVAAWMAQQERRRMAERITAGLRRARAEGKIFGRRRVVVDLEKLRALHAGGLGYGRISELLSSAGPKVSPSTVKRRIQGMQ